MTALVDYGFYVLPGLALFAAWFALAPKGEMGLRIAVLLAAFVLMRDAMTPLGIWAPSPQMQIGFASDPLLLIGLGAASLGVAVGLAKLAPDLGRLLVMFRNGRMIGLVVGFTAGAAIAAPIALTNGVSLLASPALPAAWVLGMLALAYGGNALEEVLFRGFLQGHLESLTTPLRAALASGVAFAACHGFLAFTVTQLGWPILAFTLVEGIACALVRMRYGLAPAIATHGTAILLISTPLAA